jgi:RNA polymerase sigma factor (sigma-70 family)
MSFNWKIMVAEPFSAKTSSGPVPTYQDKPDSPTPDDLSALMMAVGRDRDLQAFELLFRHFGPRISAYMARLAADMGTAEELMQETMIAVWNKAALYDPAKGNVSTWIFTIARNLRVDALRKDKRPAFDLEDPALVADDTQPADETLQLKQHSELLKIAMAGLPADQGKLIRMCYFDDLSHSAIAERLKLPIGTVKSRIRLAFAKLRSAMEAI